jgi:hypothetical protein
MGRMRAQQGEVLMVKSLFLIFMIFFFSVTNIHAASASDPRFFGTYCGNASFEYCVKVKVTFLGFTVSRRTVRRTVDIDNIRASLDYVETVKGGLVDGAGTGLLDGEQLAFAIAGVVTDLGKMKGSATVAGFDPYGGTAVLSDNGLALTIQVLGITKCPGETAKATIRKDACGNNPPQVNITSFPAGPIRYGQIHFFVGEVSDVEDTPLPASTFEPSRLIWTYDDSGLLEKSASGLRASTKIDRSDPFSPSNPQVGFSMPEFALPVLDVTATFLPPYLPPGGHKVTLTAIDSGGLTARANVQVTVINSPPDIPTIFMPLGGGTYSAGCDISFLGQAYDIEDGFITGSGLAWSSDMDGPIGIGTDLTASLDTPGTHTIRLTATDSLGESSIATTAINIQPSAAGCAPIARIVSPPYTEWKGAMAIVSGEKITFVGTAEDQEDFQDDLVLEWKLRPISPSGPDEPLGSGSGSIVEDVEFSAVGADRRYEVIFTATDSDGNQGQDKMTILVLSSPIL